MESTGCLGSCRRSSKPVGLTVCNSGNRKKRGYSRARGWPSNGEVLFGSGFDRHKVCFGSSKDIFLLQLADFAAFVLNRMQLTGGKEMVKPKERHLLQIVQPMIHLYQDISRVQFKIYNETGRLIQVERESEA